MKLRALTAGLALLVTGSVIGLGAQQFASADVSSGDRPVLVPIESCRLADTRPAFNVGPRTAPLGPTETYRIDAQQSGTDCTGDIPTSASGLAVNVTAPDSTGESFITLWATGDRPNGSTLNPQAGQLVFNAATIDLAPDNTFLVYNNDNNVHLIIDVIGYYENHDHDDRYYTEAEVNGALDLKSDADDTYTRSETDAAIATAGPLVYGRIAFGGSISSNSGLIESSSYVPADEWYRITLSGINYNTTNYVTLATPHCSSSIQPSVSVGSVGGDMLVSIDDDGPVAAQCAFSLLVYAAP